jgi:di/tricarboxylate transporter
MIFTAQLGIPLWAAAMAGVAVLFSLNIFKTSDGWKMVAGTPSCMMMTLYALGTAMSVSGLADMLANWCASVLARTPANEAYVGIVFVICTVLTQFMNNTATANLFAPLILANRPSTGLDPKIGLMTMNVAAAAAFATPIGTPCNMVCPGVCEV